MSQPRAQLSSRVPPSHSLVTPTRNSFLERFARVPETSDRCLQTDGPSQASAGVQAPSALLSSVEMLEARALAPEGVGGGSVYRGGKRMPGWDAGHGADASYSLAGTLGPCVGGDAGSTGEAAPPQAEEERRGVAGSGSASHRPGAPTQLPAVIPVDRREGEGARPSDRTAEAGPSQAAPAPGTLPPAPPPLTGAAARRASGMTAESRPGPRAQEVGERGVFEAAPAPGRPAAGRRLSLPALSLQPEVGRRGAAVRASMGAPARRALDFDPGQGRERDGGTAHALPALAEDGCEAGLGAEDDVMAAARGCLEADEQATDSLATPRRGGGDPTSVSALQHGLPQMSEGGRPGDLPPPALCTCMGVLPWARCRTPPPIRSTRRFPESPPLPTDAVRLACGAVPGRVPVL